MKKLLLFVLICLSLTFAHQAYAQKQKSPSVKKVEKAEKQEEKQELNNALQLEDLNEKISTLERFLEKFPESKQKTVALGALAEAYLKLGEKKLAEKNAEGISDFKKAILKLPEPIDNDFFEQKLARLPGVLFFNGYRNEAFEIARLLEEKIKDNPKQVLSLATFYISVENGSEAQRLAERAIGLDEKSSLAYQTLGLAHRMNFDLESAETAYAKALELDPDSVTAKRNLADVKRALGKSEEAIKLYQEILQAKSDDVAARNGLILTLFDAGKTEEAEKAFQEATASESQNFILLANVAYQYALRGMDEKAISTAQKAIEIEPRYIWAYIAQAQAYLNKNNPSEAERILQTARQYSNFPTLDYYLALARFSSGFYKEAVETLQKSFQINDDGSVKTLLGNRISKKAESFSDLLASEFRAGVFQPQIAKNLDVENKLKSLLSFEQKLEAGSEEEIIKAAENFVDGNDKTKVHRQIFIASRLLEKKKAASFRLNLIQQATESLEQALEVTTPSSFVLAEALYENRKIAQSRGQMIIVPELSRQTLLNILRGRVEEIAGWTLYEQNKTNEAIVRLKRAISILPENSVWWRSSLWRLGVCYETIGNLQAALDAYVKSYKSGDQDQLRYTTIENLYKRIHGNTDGLEKLLQSEIKQDFLVKQTVAKVEKSIEQTSDSSEKNSTKNLVETVTKANEEKSGELTLQNKQAETSVIKEQETITEQKKQSLVTQQEETDQRKEQESVGQQQNEANQQKEQTEPKQQKEQNVVTQQEEKQEKSQEKLNEEKVTDEKQNEGKLKEEQSEKVSEEKPTETPTSVTEKTLEEKRDVSTEKPLSSESPKKEETEKLEIEANLPNSLEKIAKTSTQILPNPKIEQLKIEPSTPVVEKSDLLAKEDKKSEEEKSEQSLNPETKPTEQKSSKQETTKEEVKPQEIVEAREVEKKESEIKKENSDEKSEVPKKDSTPIFQETRPRVVKDEDFQIDENCSLVIGEKEITILRNGGRLGVLIGYTDPQKDLSKIKAISGSPSDIAVEIEPEIAKTKIFLVIKSISDRAGKFLVFIKSPCGTGEIVVNVR